MFMAPSADCAEARPFHCDSGFARTTANEASLTAAMAMAFLNVPVPGIVLGSPGLPRVRAPPGYHSMEKIPASGTTVNEPWMCTGQAGMAYFLHHDRGVLADSLAVLHRLEDAVELHDIWPHFGSACRAA